MAKTTRSFSAKGILPEYSAGARFCYFLDLYNSVPSNPPLSRHKA